MKNDMQEALAMQKQVLELEQRIEQTVLSIQERLQNGQSTGDPVRDFVIAHHGVLDSNVEAPYRAIYDALHGKTDVPVFFLDDSGYSERDGLKVLPSRTAKMAFVSDDPIFNAEEGSIEFPVDNHLFRGDMHIMNSWDVQEGSIDISPRELVSLKYASDQVESSPGHVVSLHIGDAVLEYFGRSALSKQIYAEAALMLGKEVPDDFREAYIGWKDKRKDELVRALKTQETAIDRNSGNTGSSVGYRQMEFLLKQAVALGMHEEECVFGDDDGSMDVPAYVLRLCQEHSVELTQ